MKPNELNANDSNGSSRSDFESESTENGRFDRNAYEPHCITSEYLNSKNSLQNYTKGKANTNEQPDQTESSIANSGAENQSGYDVNELEKTLLWAENIGVSPMPESPKECWEQRGIKDGKAPTYLDKNGKAYSVDWKVYQERRPTKGELSEWFSYTKGIGALAGWNGKHYIAYVDFDFGKSELSTFANEQELNEGIAKWMEEYPIAKEAPRFKTPSGGYRFVFALEEKTEWTHFTLNPQGNSGKRHGEFLSRSGGHTLLPPTIGVDGKRYEWLYFAEYPPVVKDAAAIGLYPSKKARGETKTDKPNRRARGVQVSLKDCLSKSCLEILKGKHELIKADRSHALTKLLNDAQGWLNFLEEEGFTCSDNLEQLAEEAWENFGSIKGDHDKWRRILETIEPANRPALEHAGGKNACLRRLGTIDDMPQGCLPVWTNDKAPMSMRLDSLFADYYGDCLKWNPYKPDFLLLDGKPSKQTDLESEIAKVLGKDAEPQRVRGAVGRLMSNEALCVNHPKEEFLKAHLDYRDAKGFIKHLGEVVLGFTTPLEMRYLTVFLLGWVNRIFNPGCQHDTVFILISETQGYFKTNFFRTLAGYDYFEEIKSIPRDKDEKMVLARNTIIEFGEIDCMFGQRGNSERKMFLTKMKDSYRKPYDADITEYRRPLVFVGTTNKTDILSDITGDRRYHPVLIKKPIDLEWLKEHRLELMSEVYSLHLAGEPSYLTKEEEQMSQEVNLEQFTDQGVYYDQVVRWMNGNSHDSWDRGAVTTNQVFESLGLEKVITKLDQMEIAKSLKALGFVKTATKKTFNKLNTYWWFMPTKKGGTWEDFMRTPQVEEVKRRF
jgi:hypothetical protein